MTDTKEEVFVVPEDVGDAFDDIDLVVHPFEHTRGQPAAGLVNRAREDATDLRLVHRPEATEELGVGIEPRIASEATYPNRSSQLVSIRL